MAVRGQDAWNIGRDLILGHGRAEIGIRAHSYHPLCIAVAQRDGGLVALLRTLPPVPSPTYNPVNLALVQNDMPLAWQLVGDGWDIQDPDVFLHLPQWSAIGMPEDRFLVFLRPRWTDWKRRYAAIHAELLLSFHPLLADYIPVRTLAGIVISYL
jgi:hypothetical protein